MDAPARLAVLDRSIEKHRRELERAQRKKSEFILRHCQENPLSAVIIAAMTERVQGGKPLCCDRGLEWLAANVDPVWATVLNRWAYETLSCSGDSPEKRQRYAQLVRDADWQAGLAAWGLF